MNCILLQLAFGGSSDFVAMASVEPIEISSSDNDNDNDNDSDSDNSDIWEDIDNYKDDSPIRDTASSINDGIPQSQASSSRPNATGSA